MSVIQEYLYWKGAASFNYHIKISITQYAVGNFYFFLISLWEYVIYI